MKISQLPQDASPTTSDYIPGVQASVPGTVRFLLSSIISLFWTLSNIPSGATSPITRDNESQFAFVASGGVWTADAVGSTRNASMTALVCYINGRRISISAVTSRTFTASVDTYIDVLDNGDGTGTLVYTTAINNAASPALAANSIRLGIIITGATTIATTGSINQGQPTAVLPIASSIAYITTDSLGNLINPRDSSRNTLGYTELVAGQSSITTIVDVTGMSAAIITPSDCYEIELEAEAIISCGTAGTSVFLYITDGSNNIQVQRTTIIVAANINALQTLNLRRKVAVTPNTSYTFKLRASAGVATTINQGNATASPSILRIARA